MVFGHHRHNKHNNNGRLSPVEAIPVAVPVPVQGRPISPNMMGGGPMMNNSMLAAPVYATGMPVAPMVGMSPAPTMFSTVSSTQQHSMMMGGGCAPAPMVCGSGMAMGTVTYAQPTEDWESHGSMNMCGGGMRTSEVHESHVHHEHLVKPPPVRDVVVQEHHHHHTEILPPPVHDVVHQEHVHHHQRILPAEHIVEKQDVHIDHFNTVQQAPIVNHIHQTMEHYDQSTGCVC